MRHFYTGSKAVFERCRQRHDNDLSYLISGSRLQRFPLCAPDLKCIFDRSTHLVTSDAGKMSVIVQIKKKIKLAYQPHHATGNSTDICCIYVDDHL